MLSEFEEDLKPVQQKYVSTYVQRLYLELQKIKTETEIENLPHHLGIFKLKEDNSLDVLKRAMLNAMSRKDLICDFEDTKHPEKFTGRCQDEDHYENREDDLYGMLSEKEMEEFYKIKDKNGWHEACEKFDDKINPDNQELKLTLGFDEDNQKLNDTEPTYICDYCYQVLVDNADGIVSCDMDDYEFD